MSGNQKGICCFIDVVFNISSIKIKVAIQKFVNKNGSIMGDIEKIKAN